MRCATYTLSGGVAVTFAGDGHKMLGEKNHIYRHH